MNLSLRRSAPVSGLLTLAVSASAFAQSTPGGQTPVQPTQEWMPGVFFSLRGGYEHQFQTDVDGGGDLGVSRGSIGLAVRTQFTPDVEATFTFGYGIDNYRFDNVTLMGGDPWDDIHTISLGAVASFSFVNDWTVFGGPVLQFSRESGATWGEGFVGGGVLGATWRVNDDLTVGGGFGVVTQLEGDARLFPVIVVDWRITDSLRISSRTDATGWGDIGAEIIYSFAPGWEAAGGAAYRFRRFRLDDSGIAPDGVGQETTLPLWVRLTWHAHQNVSVNFYGGIVGGGELQLKASNGNRIAGEDYDPAGMLGASVNLRY